MTRLGMKTALATILMVIAGTVGGAIALDRTADAQPYPEPAGNVMLICPVTAVGQIRFGPVTVRTRFPIVALVRSEEGHPIRDKEVLLSIESEPGTDADIEGSKQTVKFTNPGGVVHSRVNGGSTSGFLVLSASVDDLRSQCVVRILALSVGPP